MPTLDLTEALTAIEFQDAFLVTTTTSWVSTVTGVAADTLALPITVYGVVVPEKESRLMRMPNGSRFAATIYIYTQFQLTNGWKIDDSNSRKADIVTWAGRQYTVMAVENYERFGQGFICAHADLLVLNPATA